MATGDYNDGDVELSAEELSERLERAERVISRWGELPSSSAKDGNHLPWNDSPEEIAEYFSAVDDLISISDDFHELPTAEESSEELAEMIEKIRQWRPEVTESPQVAELRDRAKNLLKTARDRLKEEFRFILVQNSVSVPLVSETLIEPAHKQEEEEEEEEENYEDESSAEDFKANLVNPQAVPRLLSIANRFHRELGYYLIDNLYVSVRSELHEEWLNSLGIEKIEDVDNTQLTNLDEKMATLTIAFNLLCKVLIPGEFKLAPQIFQRDASYFSCSVMVADGVLTRLMTTVKAVLISRERASIDEPFSIIDFGTSVGSNFTIEVQELFERALSQDLEKFQYEIALSVWKSLSRFQATVQTQTSSADYHARHQRYVMNYLKRLMDYEATISEVIAGFEDEQEEEEEQNSAGRSPLGRRVVAAIALLESDIEEKSKLFYGEGEEGLRYLFFMNSMNYVVGEVEGSDLIAVVGKEWVEKCRQEIALHAESYLRASWSGVLDFLAEDEGKSSAVEEKLKGFNLAFEEVLREQSTFGIEDEQFREKIKKSIAEMLIRAYCSFTAKFGEGVAPKYTTQELEKCLSDLFQGSAALKLEA
ncbi:exocyst complex component EXO70B1-like [Wolffia australiana]